MCGAARRDIIDDDRRRTAPSARAAHNTTQQHNTNTNTTDLEEEHGAATGAEALLGAKGGGKLLRDALKAAVGVVEQRDQRARLRRGQHGWHDFSRMWRGALALGARERRKEGVFWGREVGCACRLCPTGAALQLPSE